MVVCRGIFDVFNATHENILKDKQVDSIHYFHRRINIYPVFEALIKFLFFAKRD